MATYVQISEDWNQPPMELPTEDDGILLLSTLQASFPGATSLAYRNPETMNLRTVRVRENGFYPPPEGWEENLFIAMFPKDKKRKGNDDDPETQRMAKNKKVDKTSDLIVLGLPWKTTEEDLQEYFAQFGELVMAQIKKDPKSGNSRGYGFIRYKDIPSQLEVMRQRHLIEGRYCDVKIPDSAQVDRQPQPTSNAKRIFIGRMTEEITPDDLRLYFESYGVVTDVFIPRPFRSFAFVTFRDADVAESLIGEDHVIKGRSVHIGSAEPKKQQTQQQQQQPPQQQQQFFMGSNQWGNQQTPRNGGGYPPNTVDYGQGAFSPAAPSIPQQMSNPAGAQSGQMFQTALQQLSSINPAALIAAAQALSNPAAFGQLMNMQQQPAATPESNPTQPFPGTWGSNQAPEASLSNMKVDPGSWGQNPMNKGAGW